MSVDAVLDVVAGPAFPALLDVAIAKAFADRTSPEVMAYFNTRGWSNDTVGRLMAWQTENQAAGEDGPGIS